MLFVHENNLLTKIEKNYKGCSSQISDFYQNTYLPMKTKMLTYHFEENDFQTFSDATNTINVYYNKLREFSKKYNITSQSKFESTYLEEISVYLFREIPEILNGTFGIFNKKIYAGLKIDSNKKMAIITKDVDFCIGKKVNISIDKESLIELILPIVAVEVKTYLDATMFGEIKSSSKSIRSASPDSKTYVLMGYKDLADTHIIAARQDSTLTEMFALRDNNSSLIRDDAVYEYWKEICFAINSVSNEEFVNSHGRLLRG